MRQNDPSFHFFTLLTKSDQYDRMRASLEGVGFNEANSLFTVLDNRQGNAYEPYSAITEAVSTAEAPYIVFCHQDLVFYQGPDDLLSAIHAIESRDPNWAVAGNGGWNARLEGVFYLDDHSGSHSAGPVPSPVLTLDENFLVIRKESGIGCSPGMSGFHLYATDLCLNAYLDGFSAWVLEYRLQHASSTLDFAGLHRMGPKFRETWRSRIAGAIIVTPSVVLPFSPIPFLFRYANRPGMVYKIMSRFRWVRTLDYLLRHRRPDWLPMGRFEENDPLGPNLIAPVRYIDALLRRGRIDRLDTGR